MLSVAFKLESCNFWCSSYLNYFNCIPFPDQQGNEEHHHDKNHFTCVSFDQDSGFPCFKGGTRTILNLRKRFHLSLTEEVSQLFFILIMSTGFLLWSYDGCSNAYRWCSHWSVAAWMPGVLGSMITTREYWMGFYDVLQERLALDSFRNQFARILEQIFGTNRSVWGWSSLLFPA